MLVSFSVENYKSFEKEIKINFEDSHDYKFNNQCIKNGLISKVVIYGPNASGKSNFGFALFDIVGLLTDKNTNPLQNDEFTFLNADSNLEYATFTYVFRNKKDDIKYIYKKRSPKIIAYEELNINGKKIYSYDFEKGTQDFLHMDLINAENLNFQYFEKNFAILRYIANNTNQPENSYVKFIMNFVSRMLWFRSVQENDYIGLVTGSTGLGQWIIENNLAKEFQKFLRDLAGLNLNLDVVSINGPAPMKILVEKHKNKPLPLEQISSSGTKALELLFYWSRSFKDVSFLFMDEFDAFYHYDLARNVLRSIIDMDNLQAIFTTHNPNLATNEILRPDCYFNLINGKLTSFVLSTDRELREGHNLEKMLRNGEFDD